MVIIFKKEIIYIVNCDGKKLVKFLLIWIIK